MRVFWICLVVVLCWQNAQLADTGSGFSCEGRASGYYADIDSGCQIYHMCDGLGRQFSYSCPNTTLFQQRMLICDHWYMVNCSKSELDYNANLLIGQRDKPFVEDSSANPYHRTPRPDLETHPYAPRFASDYRQAKAQFGTNQNLVGVETENENGTTDGPQYFLPSHWSTHYTKGSTTPLPLVNKKYGKIGVVDKTAPLFRNEPKVVKNTKTPTKVFEKKDIIPPSRFTLPPPPPRSSFPITENINKAEKQFTRTTNGQSTFPSTTPRVVVPRVDQLGLSNPSKTLLPPRVNNRNPVPSQSSFKVPTKPVQPIKAPVDSQIANSFKNPKPARIDLPIKNPSTEVPNASPSSYLNPPTFNNFPNPSSVPLVTNEIEPPSIYYQPPKLTAFYEAESTTMDPITFYKLVPSKDLQPPKLKSRSDDGKPVVDSTTTTRSVTKKDTNNPALRPPTSGEIKVEGEKKWKDLRQMFFIPEYDFPLDLGSRPGYDSGVSSFQVKQDPPNPEIRPKDQSQEPKCDPKCNPAFLIPGTCKPCVMIRR